MSENTNDYIIHCYAVENDRLLRERNAARKARLFWEFVACCLTGVIAVLLATQPSRTTIQVGLLVLAFVAMVTPFVGSTLWTSLRGNHEMGIGDSQGNQDHE